jgi:hypothetical protein
MKNGCSPILDIRSRIFDLLLRMPIRTLKAAPATFLYKQRNYNQQTYDKRNKQ